MNMQYFVFSASGDGDYSLIAHTRQSLEEYLEDLLSYGAPNFPTIDEVTARGGLEYLQGNEIIIVKGSQVFPAKEEVITKLSIE